MLKLVLGRSGFGKTEWVLREIKRRIADTDERILLLIPEQFSFEIEKTILTRLGAKQTMRVEVYSFTRLAERVFREVGGLCGERLDDGGKAVLMSRALESLADQLTVFGRSADDMSFVSMMLSAVTEWKQACVSPEMLSQAAEKVERPGIRAKLTETALIYECYDALVQRSYLDPLDQLTRLTAALREHKTLKGYTVFVDAFRSFTGQELAVVEELLLECGEVAVTLCMDSMDAKGLGLFCPVEETARSLKRIAQQHGVPIGAPVKLDTAHRFHAPALSTLEHCVYRSMSGTDAENIQAVEIFSASNPYEEADVVAERIHRTVRTKGLHFGDFAIIARNTESYRGIIDTALEKYNVPYYLSRPERIDTKPLFVLLFSALSIVTVGYQSDDIFRYLKTGLRDMTVEEISELEHYTLLWKKSGAQWREERWDDHPRGFQSERTPEDERKLAAINQSKEKVVKPLRRLKERMESVGAATISAAIYDFLMDTQTDKMLMAFEKELEAAGEQTAAQEQSRLWEMLMECLDQMAHTAGDAPMSAKKYLDLFHMLVSSKDISFIPQTQDSVIVGNADTIRAGDCKAVFLLGANEGVFPQTEPVRGIFSDFERDMLIKAGLPIVDVRETRTAEERLYAYSAMTAASDSLMITHARMTVSGEALYPSSIVTETRRVFKNLRVQDRELNRAKSETVSDWVESPAPAFEWTAMNWHVQREPFLSLRGYFSNHPDYKGKVQAIERAVERTPFALNDPAVAEKLFGKDMTLSATRIDTFYRCPFQYFAKYGLGARPNLRAEIDPMAFGSVVHFVLEHAVRAGKNDPAAYSDNAEEHARELVERYVEENMGGAQGKTSRFGYLCEKLVRTTRDLIVHIMRERMQSDFVPTDFELAIGEDGEIPFTRIDLPDGGSLAITGSVDRVDCMERAGKTYLRVVDYKTGAKEFVLSEVLDGLNMQMLLYLWCIAQNGAARYGDIVPAGVLYMPSSRGSIGAERGFSSEDILKKQDEKLRMNGLLLDDPAALRGMEAALGGQYIPVKLKDGMPVGKKTLAGLADFGRLFQRVECTLCDMTDALHTGKIEARPVPAACDWCDYRSVCKREKGDPERPLSDMDTQAVLQLLEEEASGHGQSLD